mmetsp:Transcript_30132/g.84168  ORF Transcript_30132/g.84168 Transcript_30132/m.84168 type:complete len:298 (+) Transcript_30132:415-1308(+)
MGSVGGECYGLGTGHGAATGGWGGAGLLWAAERDGPADGAHVGRREPEFPPPPYRGGILPGPPDADRHGSWSDVRVGPCATGGGRASRVWRIHRPAGRGVEGGRGVGAKLRSGLRGAPPDSDRDALAVRPLLLQTGGGGPVRRGGSGPEAVDFRRPVARVPRAPGGGSGGGERRRSGADSPPLEDGQICGLYFEGRLHERLSHLRHAQGRGAERPLLHRADWRCARRNDQHVHGREALVAGAVRRGVVRSTRVPRSVYEPPLWARTNARHPAKSEPGPRRATFLRQALLRFGRTGLF